MGQGRDKAPQPLVCRAVRRARVEDGVVVGQLDGQGLECIEVDYLESTIGDNRRAAQAQRVIRR